MNLNKRGSFVEYQVYPEDYFNGCDVSVYFGDVWVDDIAAIQFRVSEEVQPIFGYNSYVWDAVARGKRLVQGSFRIHFRESNYLNKILMRQHLTKSNLDFWKREALERISPEEMDETMLLYQNDPQLIKSQLKNKTKEEIREMAAKIKKSNSKLPTYEDPDKTYFKNFARGSNTSFNITILYGSTIQSTAKIKTYEERYAIPPSVALKIENIQLVSCDQITGAEGAPVQEEYLFLARDLKPIEV